jgi:F0F1-type ATP synthase assembly protein I
MNPSTMSEPEPSQPHDPIMRWLVIATVAFIAACVVLIAWSASDLMIFASIVCGGTAFVLVLAIAFYAVGRSEDRERAAREGGPDGPAT